MARRHCILPLILMAVGPASLIWAGVFRGPPRTASAQAVGSVAFAPPSTIYGLGVTPVPTIDVTVENVSGLAGYEAWISYNSSVVTLTGLTDSGVLANSGQNLVVCDGPTITPGYGYLACSILPVLTPVPVSVGSTPRAIVHASFAPVAAGTSALGLTAVASGTPESTTLLDINNTPIAAVLGSGNVTVRASVGGIVEQPALTREPPISADPASGSHLLRAAVVAATLLFAATGAIAFRRRRA